jgi:hypothetical protein
VDLTDPEARVSVVIAAHGADGALTECLRAYESEAVSGDEVIVVVGTDENRAGELAARYPDVTVIRTEPRALTPNQWVLGLEQATGRVNRLAIAPCVPEAGWRDQLLAAHADAAAVGGAIEPGSGLRLRDWAVFLLRYRSYVRPFPRQQVHDVPGDHVSYTRDVIDETRSLWRAGFWEWEINREIHRRGRTLVMDPRLVVRYMGGESAWRFCAQRYRHGVRFGRVRFAHSGGAVRALYILAFLLPGLVFLLKITRDVFSRKQYRTRFVLSLPWLGVFLVAWSFGEWVGAAAGNYRDSGETV